MMLTLFALVGLLVSFLFTCQRLSLFWLETHIGWVMGIEVPHLFIGLTNNILIVCSNCFASKYKINKIQMNWKHTYLCRYSRDALPLLTSPLSEQIPKCQYCRSDLICELQILPTIIQCLKFELNGEATPIEFGNVLIFTCSKSCWDTPDKMRFEYVVVQPETP